MKNPNVRSPSALNCFASECPPTQSASFLYICDFNRFSPAKSFIARKLAIPSAPLDRKQNRIDYAIFRIEIQMEIERARDKSTKMEIPLTNEFWSQ